MTRRQGSTMLAILASAWGLPPIFAEYAIRLRVAPSSVIQPNTPAQIQLNFDDLLLRHGVQRGFQASSVRVEGQDPATGRFRAVDFQLSEHFKYANTGMVAWVIPEPRMTVFRVWFDTRPGPPRDYIPAIGVGDEILFNNTEPVTLFQQAGVFLTDFNRDGVTDAIVNTNYSNSFGWPYDGVFFRPGIKGSELLAGDFFRLHYIPENETAPKILRDYYNWAVPVDWDRDGRQDVLFVSIGRRSVRPGTPAIETGHFITFLKNTGAAGPSGLPELKETRRYPADAITKGAYVPAGGAEDLDGDGRLDFLGIRTSADDGTERLASVYFYRNRESDAGGVPVLDAPVLVKTTDGQIAGFHAAAMSVSFGDVNGDGRIDIAGADDYLEHKPTYWYENRGGQPPVFAPKREIPNLPAGEGHRWVRWNNTEGLMGMRGGRLFARNIRPDGFSFSPSGALRVAGGPLLGNYQEKPDWIDWDNDGDFDLVAGEAEGHVHLYRNVGTRQRPRFTAPVPVTADGQPLRVYRDGVFGGRHWHGAMGYPSVACVDWDQDGLFDLVVPNETNRVFWFRNSGRRGQPEFGPRRQILPDGFTESAEKLERTRLASADGKRPNHPYPYLDDEPFFWRTRMAIADYTGDGLTDLIAKDGAARVVLYARYRSPQGELRLKPAVPLYYDDGSPMDRDSAPFYKLKNVDWDGDGRVDIVVTQGWGKPSELFLRNTGTRHEPRFARGVPFAFEGRPIVHSSHGLQPSFVDWDGDGKPDFAGCNESGHYLFFRHNALTQPAPQVVIEP